MSRKSGESGPFDTTRLALTGYCVIALGLGGLLGWAALAPLASAVVATGQITVEGNHKTIQHLEGGIIRAIRVTEGAVVRAGDELIQLESETAEARASAIQSQLDMLRASEARLASEEQDKGYIEISHELLARRAEAAVDAVIRSEERLFESRREVRQQKLAAFNEEIRQLQEQISGLDAQHTSVVRQLDIVGDELKGLKRLYQEGFGWQSRMRVFERESEKLKGDLAKTVTDKAGAQARIQQIRAEIARTVGEFRERSATERQEVLQQLGKAEQELRAAADGVRRLAIVAPYAGYILNLRKHAVAGVVAPGEPLMDIVPMNLQPIVDVRIAPQDIDQVEVGQKAKILFPTLNRSETPTFNGSIEMISADRLVDATTNQPYYLSRVRIVEGNQQNFEGLMLKPGLPVEVHIHTGSRTVLSYLLKPLTDQFKRGMTEG